MKSSAKDIKLPLVDDLFSAGDNRVEDSLERVQEIPLKELHPFHDHPFKVLDDDSMMETVASIKEYGVLMPAIARPDPNGGYEIVSGHRRHHACELAGIETLPVIVRNLDDDEAIIIMVDSNLQRENILPSERAFAYKLKLEAMKHQGKRLDLTSRQVGEKLKPSVRQLSEDVGESERQVQRFIRLTNLAPQLLSLVDERKVAINPAYELSFLKKEEQEKLLSAMEYSQATPSLSQAQRLKKFSAEGRLSEDVMVAILSEEKKPEWGNVTLKSDTLKQYFPRNSTPKQMQEVIIKLLDQWQRSKGKELSR